MKRRRRSPLLIVVAVAALSLPVGHRPAAALSSPAPTCGGRTATIVSADPMVAGTPGDDVIVASGSSAQTIRGGPGDDIICGTPGPDRIFGGWGDDTIFGGSGADVIDGMAGDDTISGNLGRDTIIGGVGDDHVMGGFGDDTIGGNSGDDMLAGGGDRDILRGGLDSDLLSGGAAPDVLDPGSGADVCRADAADTMTGDCTIDAVGPAISDLDLPATVRPGEDVTFTWRAQDASGVSSTDVRVGGTQGWSGWCFAVQAQLVDGDPHDGRWSATCRVPDATINDTLEVEVFSVDILGMGLSAPVKGSFEVIGASDDRAAPTISDVVLPSAVSRGSTSSFTVHLRDETGVRFANVILRAPTHGAFIWGSEFTLISGDERDGIYRIDGEIPADAATGDFTVWIWVGDTLNNRAVQFDAGTVTVGE